MHATDTSPKNPEPGSRLSRVALLLLWLVACAGSTWYAAGWRTDNRLDHWVGQVAEDPGYRVLLEEFGGDEAVLVRADQWEPGDNPATQLLDRLGGELGELPGVVEALDPLNPPGFPSLGSGGGLDRARLEALEAQPLFRALDLVRSGTPRIDYLLRVDPAASPETRAGLARGLTTWREQARRDGVRLRAAGHPLVAAALDVEARRVERIFAPLLAILAGLAIAWYLGSLRLAGLALLPAILASSGCRAVLRGLGINSDLILVSTGPLAFVLSLACALHLISTYRRLRGKGHDGPTAARLARDEKQRAAVLAGLTTAIGFGVFGLSGLYSIAVLGTSIGVTILAIVPVIYVGLVPLLGWLGPAGKPSASRGGQPFRRLAARAYRRRAVVLATSAALVACGFVAPFWLSQETNALHYFPRGHDVRSTFSGLEAEGAALSTLEVLVARNDGRTWLEVEPDDFSNLSQRLRELESVQGVFDPGCIRDELKARLGPFAGAALLPGLQRAGRLDEAGRWLRWTVRFFNGDSAHVERIRSAVEREVQLAMAGSQATYHITGSVPLMLDMQRALLGTLASSLFYTLLCTTLLLAWVARGARTLVAALVANLAPVAVTLAAAWALGLSLDSATVMVSAVVLGLAVDNTFHLLYAAGRGAGTSGRLRAFQRVGEAATTSSFALALGFAALALSGFAPTARFGILCSVGTLAALASDLILLPALWFRPSNDSS